MGSDLTSASTSRPSFRGRFKSSTTKSGTGALAYFPWWRRKESASDPSLTALMWKCLLLWARISLVKSMSAGLSSTIRISGVVFIFAVFLLLVFCDRFDRKCELEGGSATGLGFNPDPSAMLFDNLLEDRQSNSEIGRA